MLYVSATRQAGLGLLMEEWAWSSHIPTMALSRARCTLTAARVRHRETSNEVGVQGVGQVALQLFEDDRFRE